MRKQHLPFPQARPDPRRQRGAVLIVAMILLLILTLLGVSMMNSTRLEERMAANTQEATQVFQSAETGLSQSYDDSNAWLQNPTASQVATAIPGSSRSETSAYVVTLIVATSTPPNGWQVGANVGTIYLDFQSTGQNPPYSTTLHGGGWATGPGF